MVLKALPQVLMLLGLLRLVAHYFLLKHRTGEKKCSPTSNFLHDINEYAVFGIEYSREHNKPHIYLPMK